MINQNEWHLELLKDYNPTKKLEAFSLNVLNRLKALDTVQESSKMELSQLENWYRYTDSGLTKLIENFYAVSYTRGDLKDAPVFTAILKFSLDERNLVLPENPCCKDYWIDIFKVKRLDQKIEDSIFIARSSLSFTSNKTFIVDTNNNQILSDVSIDSKKDLTEIIKESLMEDYALSLLP